MSKEGKLQSVDEILDFAIKEEEGASKFYKELSEKVDAPWMKKMLLEFSQEEQGHRNKLVKVKEGKTLEPHKEKVLDLKIGDYLVDIEPKPTLNYQEALILAMKKEKAAFRMYSDLAETTDNDDLRNVFLALAQEEAKHKLRFEVEYDEKVYQEN